MWSKPQELPQPITSKDVEVTAEPFRVIFMMTGIATPDAKQSEAYAATFALFYIFSGNSREEKVGMKLPPVWRDLWSELSEAKKAEMDAQDREIARGLRSMVRQRQDQELEDGVILPGAFRGRGNMKSSEASSDGGLVDRTKQNQMNGDAFKKIWADKFNSRKYQNMLVSIKCVFSATSLANYITAIAHAITYVEFQGPSTSSCGTESGRYCMWRDWLVSNDLIPLIRYFIDKLRAERVLRCQRSCWSTNYLKVEHARYIAQNRVEFLLSLSLGVSAKNSEKTRVILEPTGH